MIQVYEVIKDCSISYTINGEDNGFVLYKGDFFFIEIGSCWVKKESRMNYESAYTRESRLLKIYHNKLVSFGYKPEDSVYEWTWVDNINLISPKINNTIPVEYFDKVNPIIGMPPCKNVTVQWERENKLNLLNI